MTQNCDRSQLDCNSVVIHSGSLALFFLLSGKDLSKGEMFYFLLIRKEKTFINQIINKSEKSCRHCLMVSSVPASSFRSYRRTTGHN